MHTDITIKNKLKRNIKIPDIKMDFKTNNDEEEIRKFALEELEKGNPELYKIEYNELEDEMFQDYDGE